MSVVVVEYDPVAGEYQLPSGFRTVSPTRVRAELGRQLGRSANEVPIDWRVRRLRPLRHSSRRKRVELKHG